MGDIKLVIGDPKSKKSLQRVIAGEDSKFLIGKKIGDKFKGESIDLSGYEFEITGGSDNCGFPMRKDVSGSMRKKILSTSGVGLNLKRKGMRKRKTVVGNTISDSTSQVNVKVIKHGKKPLESATVQGGEEASPKEEKKEAEAPKEEKPEKGKKKEEPKTKEAPAEKPEKEEKPPEEKAEVKEEAQSSEAASAKAEPSAPKEEKSAEKE